MAPRRPLALPIVMLVLLFAACAAEARPVPAAPKPASSTAAAEPAAGTTAAAPSPTAASPAMQPFHWAGQFPATDAGIYVAMDRGYFVEQGVDLDYVNFGSASEM